MLLSMEVVIEKLFPRILFIFLLKFKFEPAAREIRLFEVYGKKKNSYAEA